MKLIYGSHGILRRISLANSTFLEFEAFRVFLTGRNERLHNRLVVALPFKRGLKDI